MIWVRKAFAYIRRDDCVLVFRHMDYPEAGLQVPAGTVQPGESPVVAVVREATEETGLIGLRVVRFLGQADRDMQDFGVDQVHERWFFELACDGEPPHTWDHDELHGGGEPIRFVFTWEPIAALNERLIADHGALLHMIGTP
jgi:8-oxo-dGTP pyrophosphatase MutT (NUDIX family)